MAEAQAFFPKSELAAPVISPELMERLGQAGQPMHFEPGEVIYLQDSSSGGVYCIRHGRAKVIQLLEDGTEVILNLVADGGSFGEVSALDRASASPTAVSMSDLSCVLIPAERVCDLIRTDPDFAIYITYSLVHKVRSAASQLKAIAGQRVMSRLAGTILALDTYSIPKDETGEWYALTHAELASLISATRSNVSVLLSDFARRGLVENKRNRLRVLDPKGLLRLAVSDVK